MTIKTRIIPIVLWDGRTAVHTVSFGEPQSAGSIEQAMSVYGRRTCDELMLLDIAASREGRGPIFPAIRKLAGEIFCPLTIGGGVRRMNDAVQLIRDGADKVVIGHRAGRSLLGACAKKMGRQSVVVAIDHRLEHHREATVALALYYEHAGAGEIVLTSAWHQGRRAGYDLPLIEAVAGAVKIPVVANGGCGHPSHMLEALDAGAHAVAAGTMFAFTQWTPRSCADWLGRNGVLVRMD
jgi:imidazole glycerol-phosphate synthase subunit HisF